MHIHRAHIYGLLCKNVIRKGKQPTKKGEFIMVKSTGIVRKVDELGRVVIPIELRRNLGIDERDGMEIFVEDDRIILKKYSPSCIFCNNAGNMTVFSNKNVCANCIEKLKELSIDTTSVT